MANQFTKKYTDRQLQNHRKKWVAALRSGEYEQTLGMLKDNGGAMCCLGVACEVSGLGKWDGKDSQVYKSGTTSKSTSKSVLTSEVRSWLGMRTTEGAITDPIKNDEYVVPKLTSLNDDAGWDFGQIADLVESNPKGLFI